MKQQTFEKLYEEKWRLFEMRLAQLETGLKKNLNKRPATPENIDKFASEYRTLCHLCAMALKREYSTSLITRLENLVARGHQVLYRPRPNTLRNFLDFLLVGFPNTVRQEKWFVGASAILFLLPMAVYLIAVIRDPAMIYSLIPAEMVDQFETMYRPGNETFGAARGSSTDWMMFGYYIWNNIGIAFRTFATGIFFGLGSIFFIVNNGLVLGGVSGHILNINYSQTFFSFVIGHGSFELTAIVLAGAAGMKLGYSLLVPGPYSRKESLKRACVPAASIVYGVAVMLCIAAFIEAFWSSSSTVDYRLKYVVGGLLWVLVFCYLGFSGRRHATGKD